MEKLKWQHFTLDQKWKRTSKGFKKMIMIALLHIPLNLTNHLIIQKPIILSKSMELTTSRKEIRLEISLSLESKIQVLALRKRIELNYLDYLESCKALKEWTLKVLDLVWSFQIILLNSLAARLGVNRGITMGLHLCLVFC